MNRFPARLGWGFKIFGKVVDKEGGFRFRTCCLERFLVNIWVGFSASNLVRVDPMVEKREEVAVGFEMLDMGCAGVGNNRKGVVGGKLPNQSNAFWQWVENVAEGLLQFLLRMGEIEIFGQKGEVLIAGVVTSFVIVSPFVRPYLFAEGLYALA